MAAEEKRLHINCSELKAGLLGLQSLCHQERESHIRIYMDNTMSCAYLNNFREKTNLEQTSSGNMDMVYRPEFMA